MYAFNIFPITIYRDDQGKIVKQPMIKDWYNQATTDPNTIAQWQKTPSFAAWGVPTGSKNGILVVDIDVKGGKEGFKSLETLGLPDTFSQETLSGGKHLIYQLPQDNETYGNRIGILDGVDIKGEGGYIVWYGKHNNIQIQRPPRWLKDQAIKKASVFNEVPSTQSDTTSLLNYWCERVSKAQVGERNVTLNLASYLLGQCVLRNLVSREHSETLLLKAALSNGSPEKGAKDTINSGLTSGLNTPVATSHLNGSTPNGRWTPKPFTIEGLKEAKFLRKPVIFDDWLSASLCLTNADGGTGKTTLKLHESICMALGRPFLGFPNRRHGRTLYITGEDEWEEFESFVGMIARQMKLNQEELYYLTQSLFVKKDNSLQITQKPMGGFITPNLEALGKVCQAIDDIKPLQVVFDPLSFFWGSEKDLNDTGMAVVKFMAEIKRRYPEMVIEMIHHKDQASSNSKSLSQFSGRGGTSIPNHCRIVKVLQPIDGEEFLKLTGEELGPKEQAIVCQIDKHKDFSSLLRKPFVIKRNGWLFERCATVPGTSGSGKANYEREVLNTIQVAQEEGKAISLRAIKSKTGLSERVCKDTLEVLEYDDKVTKVKDKRTFKYSLPGE